MRVVDAAEVRAVATFEDLIAGLDEAHRRPRIEVQDSFLGEEGRHYFVRHAVDPGRFMASKLITSVPANLAEGRRPAVQAVCVLFDGRDGRPLAVIDGTEITGWRTAATCALGARYLARPDPTTMLVVGAGQLARHLVAAHRTVRPSLDRVRVWNRTTARADALVSDLRRQGIAADVVRDLDAAIGEADLITTCTRSREPLIHGRYLKPGAHLDLVGSYTPQTRESDDEAIRRARVFVDRRETALQTAGDITQPIASGALTRAGILGDLYDLAGAAVPGRRTPEEITLFKMAGGCHLDLMTCEIVLRRLGVLD